MTKLESTTRGSTDPTRIETADGANHSHHGFDPIKARAMNLGSIGVAHASCDDRGRTGPRGPDARPVQEATQPRVAH
jgi:hypothetical protein